MEQCLVVFMCAIIVALCYDRTSRIDDTFKLPKNVKPVRYILTVEPEMDVNIPSPTFSGSVTIELKCLETSDNITLHARYLNISEDTIKVVNSGGTELKFLNTSLDKSREFYTIFLGDQLLEEQYYNLTIGEFSGFLKYDNVGLYLAKYTKEDGQDRHVAITDFEPSDARKAFPCFDEPSSKATFIINIIRPENYTSVANEDTLSTKDLGDGRFQDTFKETIPMPTYVVAYAVFDFKHTPRIEGQRVFARSEAVETGKLDYALSEGIEVLKILEEYTGLNYSLSKMDQLAVPDKYFNDEAMENWGLVTYSEKHLFISNQTAKTEDYQRCTSYISHEFSHQWFGNMVTFNDWEYLWLSEGFGAFMQYYITSLAKPSWRYMDQFVLEILHAIYDYDITDESEPLNYKPKRIGGIPSPWICYYKASTVLRMLQNLLTPTVFQRGLSIYLEKNKFAAVEPSDLYEALQKAVDEAGVQHLLGNHSLSSIMKTWDSNAGYPLLNVSRDYESGAVTITQNRYFEDDELESDSMWYVPISYAQPSKANKFSNTAADMWLTEKEKVYKDVFSSDSWLLINKQQAGVYRVNYDVTNWNRLAFFLNTNNFNSVHVINRAQLIYDAFDYAKNGLITFDIPLNISKYLIRETDYVAITPFINAISYLNRMMGFSEMYAVFQDYVIDLLSNAYEHLGFDEKPTDTTMDKLNRIQVLAWMCKLGHSECRKISLQKLRDWKETNELSASPDMERVILSSAMRSASADDWEFLYNKALVQTTKKLQYLQSLACSQDKNILYSYLKRMFSSTATLTQSDQLAAIMTLTSSKIGLEVILKFLQENEDLPKRVQSTIAYYAGMRLTSEDKLAEFQKLNKTRDGLYNYGIRLIERNIEWLNQSHRKEIEDWLQDYQESTNRL